MHTYNSNVPVGVLATATSLLLATAPSIFTASQRSMAYTSLKLSKKSNIVRRNSVVSVAQVPSFQGNLKTALLGRPPSAFLPEEPELARVPLFFSKRHCLPGHSPHQFTSGNFPTPALLDRQLF